LHAREPVRSEVSGTGLRANGSRCQEELPMDTHHDDEPFIPTLLLRVEEAATRLGIGRTSMYRLVMTGEVESVQIGGLRRIPAPCLEEYVDRLRHRDSDPAA
jgi:excisionase family DNA binding protein